jgi:hypothetical protein
MEPDTPPQSELDRLRADRDMYVEQIKDLCAKEGIYDFDSLPEGRTERLERLRTRDGSVLPPNLKRWITNTLQRLELVLKMVAEVEAEQGAER